jgi:hypothetical protein
MKLGSMYIDFSQNILICYIAREANNSNGIERQSYNLAQTWTKFINCLINLRVVLNSPLAV